jgi:alkanesulfonate monooxygenase SsuD/methylene tetrahydromethanopterin reductase-like flavin-dependent oxidoreductase (luciferase family)
VWDEEIYLARRAAALGFDCLWSAEHHCNGYSFTPDNLQLLTYLSLRCPGASALPFASAWTRRASAST